MHLSCWICLWWASSNTSIKKNIYILCLWCFSRWRFAQSLQNF